MKRKLYIMEYFAPYTGGSLIAIAMDIEDLKRVIRSYNHYYPEEFELIYDERLVQLHTLSQQPFVVDGICRDLCSLILDQLPLIKDEVNLIIDNDKSVSYKSGNIRLDWVCNKIKIPEGIYLVDSFDIEKDFSLPKIISDTYYCA